MSINYQDQDNYADLAESIATAGRPVSSIKEQKKERKEKPRFKKPKQKPLHI